MENNNEYSMVSFVCDKCGKVIDTIYGNTKDINSHIIPPIRVQTTFCPVDKPVSCLAYYYPGDLCIKCKVELVTKIEDDLCELGFSSK